MKQLQHIGNNCDSKFYLLAMMTTAQNFDSPISVKTCLHGNHRQLVSSANKCNSMAHFLAFVKISKGSVFILHEMEFYKFSSS